MKKKEKWKKNEKNEVLARVMVLACGHTAWAPEGREGRCQAGPKGPKLEVGVQRTP